MTAINHRLVNKTKVIEHLKSAGKWTMDFAKELGKDVVVAAIRQAMGIG
jgi:hypothetical protein